MRRNISRWLPAILGVLALAVIVWTMAGAVVADGDASPPEWPTGTPRPTQTPPVPPTGEPYPPPEPYPSPEPYPYPAVEPRPGRGERVYLPVVAEMR